MSDNDSDPYEEQVNDENDENDENDKNDENDENDENVEENESLKFTIVETPKKEETIRSEPTIKIENTSNAEPSINIKPEFSDEEIDKDCEQILKKKKRVKKTVDKFNNGWDDENCKVVNYWRDYLSYCCLIYHFYLFKLRKIENYWAWLIIVFSALSSTISLLQYNEENEYLELTVKILITTLTLCATLISAWMKKQNYVEHISELSKYSIKINKVKGEVNSVIREPLKNRISYDDFIKKHKDEIVDSISSRPLISPNDWKETIYIISKYFPELAAYEYPWKKIPNYGENAMKTYERIKYRGVWKKIKNGYFFNCFMCVNSKVEHKLASSILNHDKEFYRNLSRSDFDHPNYMGGVLNTYDLIDENVVIQERLPTKSIPKKNIEEFIREFENHNINTGSTTSI